MDNSNIIPVNEPVVGSFSQDKNGEWKLRDQPFTQSVFALNPNLTDAQKQAIIDAGEGTESIAPAN